MIRPFRWALPALLCGLAACTTAPTDPIQYKSAAPRTAVVDGRTVLRIDADFARAWSQVGAALDRTGFTVEERDRAAGFYRVRYVTPRSDRDEPGLLAKLVGLGRAPATPAPLRFRIAVRGDGDATLVSVLDAAGAADAGEDARRIAAVIADDLR